MATAARTFKHDGKLYMKDASVPDDLVASLSDTTLVSHGNSTAGAPSSDLPSGTASSRVQTPEEKAAARAAKGKGTEVDTTSDATNSDAEKEKALEDFSYPELQERAKALDLSYVGVSKKDLIENIRAKEAAANTNEDEDTGDNL